MLSAAMRRFSIMTKAPTWLVYFEPLVPGHRPTRVSSPFTVAPSISFDMNNWQSLWVLIIPIDYVVFGISAESNYDRVRSSIIMT